MIREATAADVPALVAMGITFLATTAYGAHLPTNPAAITAIMQRLIGREDGTVLVTADRAGTARGMLGGACYAHPLSGEWVAAQLFWWRGPRLLAAFEAWAAAHGAVKVIMHAPIVQTGAPRRLALHYVGRGYVPMETAYQRDLTRDQEGIRRESGDQECSRREGAA